MRGKIKVFYEDRKFGFIIRDSDNEKFTFVRKGIVNDPHDLPFFEGEPVEFDHDLANQPDITKKKAIMIRREAKYGKVETFDNKKGWGYIIDSDTNKKYFIHYSNILDGVHVKIKKLYADEYVAFLVRKKEDGLEEAFNCCQLDSRPFFFRCFDFSALPNGYNEAIDILAALSSKEEDADWNYTHEKTDHANPVLYNYLQYTLLRLVELYDNLNDKSEQYDPANDKNNLYILESIDRKGNRQKYLFNTGLQTDYGEDIFAFFEDDEQKISRWRFVAFLIHSDNKLLSLFGADRPKFAIYLDDPVDFVYDPRLTLIPDVEHILETNFDRLPSDIRGKRKKDLGELLRNRIKDTEKKVQRNYRVAIPQYYNRSVQLLFPLCLSASDKVDRALVVERRKGDNDQQFYRANTILYLHQAYNNARLISPQDRAWLLP